MTKTFKKSNVKKQITACKSGSASLAIGTIEKNTDTFVLTYGQFSLIDALVAILDQTGPAHVIISTWTAPHASLDRSAVLMESASILSLRMIIDKSFRPRQPKYYDRMFDLFGAESIRETSTHSKFLVIRNEKWSIVVRTSMNISGSTRLENIEISENKDFADFFEQITTDLFENVQQTEHETDTTATQNGPLFKLASSKCIETNKLKEVGYTHDVRNKRLHHKPSERNDTGRDY